MFCKSSLLRFQVTLAASAVALMMAVPAFGQSSGVVNGSVTDGQGIGIVGVKVTATSQNPPRMVLDVETNDDGFYRIMGLRANSYEVVAEKEGLGSAAAVFTIREGQNLTIDLNLGASAAAAVATLSEEDLAKIENREEFESAFQLGSGAMQAGSHQEAINQFLVAIEILDSCYNCYQNIGISHLELGNDEEAEAAFKRVIELMPDYANAYINLSNIYNSQRRFDEAAEASAEAARLSGAGEGATTDPIAVYNQGIIYMNAQRIVEAKAQFEQTISLDPSHAEAHYWLAMTHLNTGDMADAVTALESYIELDPSGRYADQSRAMIQTLQQ
ncbi:MAG: tetratricopeptide repeat protein [Acidobacteria bacterium]|nr:tetratricopeptide repeat protein [Acidobacteriota bacterium]